MGQSSSIGRATKEVPGDVASARRLTEGANTFAFSLLKKLAQQKEENLIVSPWSLICALLMLKEGAKGASAQELQSAMNLPDDIQVIRQGYAKIISDIMNTNSKNSLNIANALFSDESCAPLKEFTKTIQSVYKGQVETVNYKRAEKATAHINSWVEKNTGGVIKGIISEGDLDATTIFLLVNAVFFKGKWKSPFVTDKSFPRMFFPNGMHGEPLEVEMMDQSGKFLYGSLGDLKAQALVLPYDKDLFYMLILLPYESSNVNEVLSKVTSVEEIIKQMRKTKVDVFVPKFKFESFLDFEATLKELGIVDVFSQQSANLRGISEDPLYVSYVIQKAIIEVDEMGTKAAAVSAEGYTLGYNTSQPVTFMANRPFVSIIAHRDSNTMLFASKIVSPQWY